jgi:hypothetical protein
VGPPQMGACRGASGGSAPSVHHDVRVEPCPFGLGTRQQGEAEADWAHDDSGKHGAGQTHVVVPGEQGDDWWHHPAEDRPDVSSEGAGRRARAPVSQPLERLRRGTPHAGSPVHGEGAQVTGGEGGGRRGRGGSVLAGSPHVPWMTWGVALRSAIVGAP